MTRGQYRVGIDFNPSGDNIVGQIKRASADLIDLIEQIPDLGDWNDRGDLRVCEIIRAKEIAATHVEEAAMWAVKAATKPEPGKAVS